MPWTRVPPRHSLRHLPPCNEREVYFLDAGLSSGQLDIYESPGIDYASLSEPKTMAGLISGFPRHKRTKTASIGECYFGYCSIDVKQGGNHV